MPQNDALANIIEPLTEVDWPEKLKLQAAAEIGLWYAISRHTSSLDLENVLFGVRTLLQDYDRQARTWDAPDTKLTTDGYLAQVSEELRPELIDIVNRLDRAMATMPKKGGERAL